MYDEVVWLDAVSPLDPEYVDPTGLGRLVIDLVKALFGRLPAVSSGPAAVPSGGLAPDTVHVGTATA
jgi:hypothetical protein